MPNGVPLAFMADSNASEFVTGQKGKALDAPHQRGQLYLQFLQFLPQGKESLKADTRRSEEHCSPAATGAVLNLPLEAHEREWFELAQELKVDAVTLEALVAIVQEGKWQQSTAPLMFVRINVERRSEEWKDPFSEDGRLYRAQIFSPVPTREDRMWAKEWACIREWAARVTPEDVEAASQTLSVVEDEEERGVLCARALGLTRAHIVRGE